ncbi:MAG TPA: hypothetical protein VMU05_01685 [Dongiaceae bacterium]|nr:hypothetical protein [Dongiaceae bacterium]
MLVVFGLALSAGAQSKQTCDALAERAFHIRQSTPGDPALSVLMYKTTASQLSSMIKQAEQCKPSYEHRNASIVHLLSELQQNAYNLLSFRVSRFLNDHGLIRMYVLEEGGDRIEASSGIPFLIRHHMLERFEREDAAKVREAVMNSTPQTDEDMNSPDEATSKDYSKDFWGRTSADLSPHSVPLMKMPTAAYRWIPKEGGPLSREAFEDKFPNHQTWDDYAAYCSVHGWPTK